ncbi:MAG: hypothetical protein RLZZ362_1463 [Actinomycetota bacterium]
MTTTPTTKAAADLIEAMRSYVDHLNTLALAGLSAVAAGDQLTGRRLLDTIEADAAVVIEALTPTATDDSGRVRFDDGLYAAISESLPALSELSAAVDGELDRLWEHLEERFPGADPDEQLVRYRAEIAQHAAA